MTPKFFVQSMQQSQLTPMAIATTPQCCSLETVVRSPLSIIPKTTVKSPEPATGTMDTGLCTGLSLGMVSVPPVTDIV